MDTAGPRRRSLLTYGGVLVASLGAGLGLAGCADGDSDPSGASASGSADPSASDGGGGGELLFDARFADAGFTAYSSAAPQEALEGEDFGIDDDPLGQRGRAAWFDSRRGLHVGTPYPRAQVLTAPFLEPGGEYWMLMDVLVPAESAPREPDAWLTLATGAFGEPFGDSSPLGLAVVRSREKGLYLQLGADYAHLEERVPFPVDRWVRLVEGFRFAADGWVELSAGSAGEDPVPVRPNGSTGQAGRIELATRAKGVNDGGANASRIGVYGTDPARIWCAAHRVATTRQALLAGL